MSENPDLYYLLISDIGILEKEEYFLIREVPKSFYEQAFRPVPQEMNFIVEQAGKPVKREWCNIAVLNKMRNTPFATDAHGGLCPMPYALCPLLAPHVTEKGYISVPTDNANPELRHLFQHRQVRQLAADIPTAESQISQTILNSADCERKLSPSEF